MEDLSRNDLPLGPMDEFVCECSKMIALKSASGPKKKNMATKNSWMIKVKSSFCSHHVSFE